MRIVKGDEMIILKMELEAECGAKGDHRCLDPDRVDFRCLTAGNQGACPSLIINKAKAME